MKTNFEMASGNGNEREYSYDMPRTDMPVVPTTPTPEIEEQRKRDEAVIGGAVHERLKRRDMPFVWEIPVKTPVVH